MVNAKDEALAKADWVDGSKYRDWTISFEYGYYEATGPNYDAEYRGPEEGWVDNGECVQGRTRAECEQAVDDYIEEHNNEKA